MDGDTESMATAKPSRNRRQPSAKTPSKAQLRQQRKQQSLETTQKMADAAYLRTYRHTQIAIARQQAKQQALTDAGIKQQQPPVAPQQKQKPLTKAPSSGRKPQNQKPPKR